MPSILEMYTNLMSATSLGIALQQTTVGFFVVPEFFEVSLAFFRKFLDKSWILLMLFLLKYAVDSVFVVETDNRHVHGTVFDIIEVPLHPGIIHLLHHELGVFFVEPEGSLLILGKEYHSRCALI